MVYRVQVFHHEHIIYGHVHQQTVGEPDGVVRVVQVRGHLYQWTGTGHSSTGTPRGDFSMMKYPSPLSLR